MSELLPDHELLREFTVCRSESAFEALVKRHVDLVYATALRRVGEETTAQEITQDVFIALANKAAWLRHENSLSMRALVLTGNCCGNRPRISRNWRKRCAAAKRC